MVVRAEVLVDRHTSEAKAIFAVNVDADILV
jgi:hypothetical protein